jgi:hypothetical protein
MTGGPNSINIACTFWQLGASCAHFVRDVQGIALLSYNMSHWPAPLSFWTALLRHFLHHLLASCHVTAYFACVIAGKDCLPEGNKVGQDIVDCDPLYPQECCSCNCKADNPNGNNDQGAKCTGPKDGFGGITCPVAPFSQLARGHFQRKAAQRVNKGL